MTIFLPHVQNSLPQFYYLLNDNDKLQYQSIRKSQKEGQKKTEIIFSHDIETLKKFIVRGDEDDWKRGIVCGIYWLPENKGIAVNIQQLKIILNKSKSSLNASLTKIGLDVVLTRGKAINHILNIFPVLQNQSNQVRQWTIRKFANNSPPNSPIQNDIPQPIENGQAAEQNKGFQDLVFESSRNDEYNQCNEIFFLCFC